MRDGFCGISLPPTEQNLVDGPYKTGNLKVEPLGVRPLRESIEEFRHTDLAPFDKRRGEPLRALEELAVARMPFSAGQHRMCSNSCYRLILLAAGCGAWRVNLGSGPFCVQLKIGSMLLAAAGVEAVYEVSRNAEVISVFIPSPWLEQELGTKMAKENGLLRRAFEDHFASRLTQMLCEEKRNCERWSRSALAMGRALTARLADLAEMGSMAPEEGGLSPRALKLAEDILRKNISQPLALSQLAQEVGLSLWHFSRSFKASTGLPPHKYQLMLRAERAKELLQTTRMSVIAIAGEVGYEDPAQLARIFRSIVGQSPTQFRLAMQAAKCRS